LIKQFYKTLTTDTIPTGNKKKPVIINNDSIAVNDTLPINSRDSTTGIDTVITKSITDTFFIKSSKDSLDAPVVYHADDSMILDVPGKKILLYGKDSKVKYTDNEVNGPRYRI
jgi:hypothetical protein